MRNWFPSCEAETEERSGRMINKLVEEDLIWKLVIYYLFEKINKSEGIFICLVVLILEAG